MLLSFKMFVLLLLVTNLVLIDSNRTAGLRRQRVSTEGALHVADHLRSASAVLDTHAALGTGPFDPTSTATVWHTGGGTGESHWVDATTVTNTPGFTGGWRHHHTPCDWTEHPSCWRAVVSAGDTRTFRDGAAHRATLEASVQVGTRCANQGAVTRPLPVGAERALLELLADCEDAATVTYTYGRRTFPGYTLHAATSAASPNLCDGTRCLSADEQGGALTRALSAITTDDPLRVRIDDGAPPVCFFGTGVVVIEHSGAGQSAGWFQPPVGIDAAACEGGVSASAQERTGGPLPLTGGTPLDVATEVDPFCNTSTVLCLTNPGLPPGSNLTCGTSPGAAYRTPSGAATYICPTGDLTVSPALAPAAGTGVCGMAAPANSAVALVAVTGNLVLEVPAGCTEVRFTRLLLLAPQGTLLLDGQADLFELATQSGTERVVLAGSMLVRHAPVIGFANQQDGGVGAGNRTTGWALHLDWPEQWDTNPPHLPWWPSLLEGEWQRIV